MKVLVIFGALFAFTQASDFSETTIGALSRCTGQHGGIERVTQILKSTTVSEDDQEVLDFFNCFYTKIGFLKGDGELDVELAKSRYPQWIASRYPKADAAKLAKATSDHCVDAPKGHKGALAGIKLRNCVLEYIKDNHQQF